MSEGKTVKLVDIIEDDTYRIFKPNEEKTVTPTSLFDLNGVPESKRFSFVVKPMSYPLKKRVDAALRKKSGSTNFLDAMGKAGVTFADLYGAEINKDSVNNINMEAFRKVTPYIEEDIEHVAECAEEMIKAVKECVLSIVKDDESFPFIDHCDRFGEEFIDFLFNEIYAASTLTKDEELAL